MRLNSATVHVCFSLAMIWLCAGGEVLRAGDTNTAEVQLRRLQEQNDALQSQLRDQRELIDALTRDVSELRKSAPTSPREADSPAQESMPPDGGSTSNSGLGFGNVRISGEGAAGFFESGAEGKFPHSEFRVDEARLFVDARVWRNVYAFAELNLVTPESSDVDLNLGELYLDVEDLSQLWGKDRQLNFRAGRFYIPFGEEYLTRHAIDNPLITTSLVDLWGVDEGLEIYGTLGKFSYVVAVQNGGVPTTRDFDPDKSVTGRLSYDPARRWHLSVSAMRTGQLNVQNDRLSELWFGKGWFRSLGSSNTTSFNVTLVEGDIAFRLPRGHLKAFGGYIRYDDDDPAADNGRDVYYYCVEGVHDLFGKLYGAARFSQILAGDGFPLVGNGQMSEYLFGPLTEDLWAVSLGLGYRWSPHLVLKTECTFGKGTELGGETRDHENLFAAEVAFGF